MNHSKFETDFKFSTNIINSRLIVFDGLAINNKPTLIILYSSSTLYI